MAGPLNYMCNISFTLAVETSSADYPACRDYVARAEARPAFVKAHADQMAHFAAAD